MDSYIIIIIILIGYFIILVFFIFIIKIFRYGDTIISSNTISSNTISDISSNTISSNTTNSNTNSSNTTNSNTTNDTIFNGDSYMNISLYNKVKNILSDEKFISVIDNLKSNRQLFLDIIKINDELNDIQNVNKKIDILKSKKIFDLFNNQINVDSHTFSGTGIYMGGKQFLPIYESVDSDEENI